MPVGILTDRDSYIQAMHAEAGMLLGQLMQLSGFCGPPAGGEYPPAGLHILAGKLQPDAAVTAGDQDTGHICRVRGSFLLVSRP